MEDIFKRYEGEVNTGTDKNTTHSYLAAYERVFEPKRHDAVRVLEIGVFTGGSLRAWADYFDHADSEIIGLDINPNLVRFDLSTPKIKTMVLDATNREAITRLNGEFDFIIDDGSHALRDQVLSFSLLKSRIRTGGAYIIEDVQSMDDARVLMTIGEENDWNAELSDTRHIKGRYDDLMIIYTKK
jgi:demethylmacrocin O-methyltransferase